MIFPIINKLDMLDFLDIILDTSITIQLKIINFSNE